ncbi:MAG TPA: class I SAM-dependent methyltransferase [Polyangia bacterium]|nr:class I SAM-dependent methyltransferase [Polyangia bacterium]
MATPRDDEKAGAIEPFEDAVLYDWEYRRRRSDVRFYRTLADERGGPVLDLACGTGRLLLPLVRDGHVVVGLDQSPPMLARAAARIRRLAAPARARALLVRGDLRAFNFRRPFALAVCAFHSIQHLISDDDLTQFLRAVRRSLIPGGWFAFDLFAPEKRFLARASDRRWDRTVFRHPGGERLVYTMTSRLSPDGKTLLMTMYYQPIDARGRRRGAERVVRLCHRQLPPAAVHRLLKRAGLQPLFAWGGFDGAAADPASEQHIYLARRP